MYQAFLESDTFTLYTKEDKKYNKIKRLFNANAKNIYSIKIYENPKTAKAYVYSNPAVDAFTVTQILQDTEVQFSIIHAYTEPSAYVVNENDKRIQWNLYHDKNNCWRGECPIKGE